MNLLNYIKQSVRKSLLYPYLKTVLNLFSMSKVNLSQIAELLINDFGIKYGDTIIVHTSYKHISECDYEPEDLIFLLKTIVGSKGNIIMPSFRRSKEFYNQVPFNVKSTKGRSGLINEILRRSPDTVQSIHPWKSCVVWGKDAQELTKDHFKSERAFDENSPYYKAMLLHGKYVGIGVGIEFCSFLHTIEDNNTLLFDEVYDLPITQKIVGLDGSVCERKYRHISKQTMTTQSVPNITKYLLEPYFQDTFIRNIPFSYADLSYLYTTLVKLAEEGVSIHSASSSETKRDHIL
ncbi:MAG: AAC(3) family N-acetyltransferase [Candidatus Sabulitectum sp.]|nr:AAC(3) family N-acetyltransferase [Candidatus Sabulitectum sp.]